MNRRMSPWVSGRRPRGPGRGRRRKTRGWGGRRSSGAEASARSLGSTRIRHPPATRPLRHPAHRSGPGPETDAHQRQVYATCQVVSIVTIPYGTSRCRRGRAGSARGARPARPLAGKGSMLAGLSPVSYDRVNVDPYHGAPPRPGGYTSTPRAASWARRSSRPARNSTARIPASRAATTLRSLSSMKTHASQLSPSRLAASS